jgi:hypothetical protein
MLPHTGSTFLDINPISTTLQNQTKPNQTTENKKEKKSQKRKKERECLSMKKFFALSRSLARDPRKRGAVSASPVSRAPPPQTETKKTTGEWARFVEIATGKNERTSRGSLTVIRTDESG